MHPKRIPIYFILVSASAVMLIMAANDKNNGKRTPHLSGGVESLQILRNDEAPGTALLPRRSCVSTPTPGYAPNVLVDCDFLDFPHNESAIVVDPLNPMRLLTGANGYDLYPVGNTIVARGLNTGQLSVDGGATWLTQYVPLDAYNTATDPVFAFDRSGNGFAANIGYHIGQGGAAASNGTVIVNRMDSGTTAWGSPVEVYRGFGNLGTSIFNDKEWMTVDTSAASPYRNNVYVTWTKFESGPGGAYLRSPIWFARSVDGGRTFLPAQEISGSGSFCTTQVTGPANQCDEDQDSVPSVAADGTIYVAFENFNTAPPEFRSQYLVVRSTDGGTTWSGPYKAADLADGLNDYPVNAGGRQTLSNVNFRVGSAGNVIAGGDGKLYLVWSDNRNGTAAATNTDVFVSVSSDGGGTWSAPENASGDPADQFFPWGAWNPVTGKLQIAYIDRKYDTDPASSKGVYGITLATRNGPGSYSRHAVHSGLSDANNSRWFGRKAAFIGDYIGLGVGADGKANVVWTDMRRTVPDGRGRKGQNTVYVRLP
ncbi:MAG: exo-alpha-sialidase [Acidobacteria bacterium]|nr:exo-alpha-sialidase [Acidobacteriota bacterium]